MTIPVWIDKEQLGDTYNIADIAEHGCVSGLYMPAVEYATARATMGEHGDAVIEYIESIVGDVELGKHDSWSALCVKCLSMAVELWCQSQLVELDNAIANIPNGWGSIDTSVDTE